MIEPETLTVEVAVAAPIGRVWSALTEPGEIRQWFGWEYDGLADEIREIFVEHVERFPPVRLAMADGSELVLAADGERTLLRVVVPGDGDGGFNPILEGWRAFTEQLRFLLERRPAGPRHTVYLTGAATGAQLLAALPPVGEGELWHDSRYLRMVVDRGGRLLTALAEQPLAGDEVAPVSLTVASYGPDDAAAAHLRDEWSTRWHAALPPAP
ncbi:activator of HSP90 ATPase [Micromonospora sp. WMMD812]|uniref:SRPBCC family protein n=1 Tax=Micromonospora sp. WMMD812 TaxID=3015152 RepID=UPI00248B2C00|nr:activator of HSP90 ATPase [Micromonospora sp. WMMD812]WBB65076.1 activator of HSP90 ATPase [Micromonospora sp. WMMD812]